MARCLHSNLFFREEKKHFLWLLKNDINVAGEDDAMVIEVAKGLGKFQGTQYLRNISYIYIHSKAN